MDTTCLAQSLASPVCWMRLNLCLFTIGRMLNTHTHTHTESEPYSNPFSPIPILPALKFYTAPFSPTLAVFYVLLSHRGNYFSLSNYSTFM